MTFVGGVLAVLSGQLRAQVDSVRDSLEVVARTGHARGDTLQEFHALSALTKRDGNAWRKFDDLVGEKDAFAFVETHGVLRRRHVGKYGRLFDAEDIWYAIRLATKAQAWTRVIELHHDFRRIDHDPPDIVLMAELRTAAYALHDTAWLTTIDAFARSIYRGQLTREWYVHQLCTQIYSSSDVLYPLLKQFLEAYPHDEELLYGVFALAVERHDWSAVTTAGLALVAQVPAAADLRYYAAMYAAYIGVGQAEDATRITAYVNREFPKERDRWLRYVTRVEDSSPEAALQRIWRELQPTEPG